MAQGDRYPEALEIANLRFHDELRRLAPGTAAHEALRQRYVPPYRNDAFSDKWRKLIMDEPAWTLDPPVEEEEALAGRYEVGLFARGRSDRGFGG